MRILLTSTRRAVATAAVGLLAVCAASIPSAHGETNDDRALRVNIEMNLRTNRSLSDTAIEVAVEDSKVSLDGRVRTLAQKWEVLDATATVHGVVEIDDRIEVTSQPPRDDALTDEVRRRFHDIPKLANAKLQISAHDGIVKVAGEIRDARLRFAARDTVGEIPGVLGFVDAMASPAADDETISDGVYRLVGPRSLTRIPGLIEVTCTEGVVTLDGWVRRLGDRIEAERRAFGVNGVTGVVNRLEVRPKPRAEDSLR